MHESIFIIARELDRHLGERIFARVDRERISRPPNYALVPQELPDGSSKLVRLLQPDVALIEVKPDGVHLFPRTASGEFGGDSRFRTIQDAQEKASLEYGEALGGWRTIPPDEPDPLAYALRAPNDG